MIFELLIISALCIAGYIFLFRKNSGATSSLTTPQENDSIVKNPTLDQKNTQEMVVGHSENITQKEIASPETKTVPPVVLPTQQEFHEAKETVSQKEIPQDRLPSFVENSNIQKQDLTETRDSVPSEVEQPIFDRGIIDKQSIKFEETQREEQRALQEIEVFENKAVEKVQIQHQVQDDNENVLKEFQEEARYQKPQEEYNIAQKDLPEVQQETLKYIEEVNVEKPETEAGTLQEKENTEEAVHPFVDEQVTTDEKLVLEDIEQQQDILKKGAEEINPVTENFKEDTFVPKEQEIGIETQEEEKPQTELTEISAPIEEPARYKELENQEEEERIEQFIDELIEEIVKSLRDEQRSPVVEQKEFDDVQIEENPFVHNQVEETITQEVELPIVETPLISELQQQPLDDLKVENREHQLVIDETQKEIERKDETETTTKDQEVTETQSSAKKATRKGFNFRTNKTKIESILPKLETPEKQNLSELSQTVQGNHLIFEEKQGQAVEDLINELGTPIQLVKNQSSEIETPFTIYEQEQAESQVLPEQPIEKTSVKRGFNFRTKKNKIESILQESSEKSSSGEILKESLIEEPQVQKEPEPFIKEIETIQVPEAQEVVSELAKAPTKRGFNFRANKNKIEKSLSQEDTKLLVEKKPLETLPIEEKPVIQASESNEKVSSSKRGFNFRTKKNKIEAMLTSVDTPEKKPVEGSEKSSSGEFQSMQQEISEEKVNLPEPEASPIKALESLPAVVDQKSIEEKDLKAQLAGKTMGAKRSFNFRANNRRIDSILKKDQSGHLDMSTENENSLSNILESTVNTSITHSTEDVLGPREENIMSLGEETIEPQTKRKGFNFRNAKKKTVIESPQKQDENSIVSGIIEKSPQKSENVLAESGKAEVKKAKGFNFRNPNRTVKAE